MDEITKRATILAKCLHIPTEKIIINQPLLFPNYMTTYIINDKKDDKEEYFVLSKKDRIDCGAWHLWMLWDGHGNVNALIEQVFNTNNVPPKYWKLYCSLSPIKTHPYVHISETHPILRQMAKIICKYPSLATILNGYDHETELTYRDFSTTRLKKYYIYRRD